MTASPLPFFDRNASEPLLGLSVMYPSVGAVERIGLDWDWIWIDAQHGDLDYREAVNLVRAAGSIGRPSLVRVPSHDASWVGKTLDAGASGIIVPMVENVAAAMAMIQAAKFPPLGNRSYGGRRVIDYFGRHYYKTANRDTLLILQLESTEAVAVADELAAIDGVDGLFLGPDDLLIREGRDVDTPKNRETIGRHYQKISASCKKHGKINLGHAVSEDTMAMAKEFGYQLVIGGGDVGLVAPSSKAAAQKLRAYFKTGKTAAADATTAPVGSLY